MKMSRRAKRMDKHHKRGKNFPAFNMISLMDIFTILVFFLLVNSSDVEVLKSSKDISLPESVAEQKPRETVQITVSQKAVAIEGNRVASFEQVAGSKEDIIPSLHQALKRLAARQPLIRKEEVEAGRQVTIMGDKEIPFSVLKKIMSTCTHAGYSRISLSVMQKSAVGASG